MQFAGERLLNGLKTVFNVQCLALFNYVIVLSRRVFSRSMCGDAGEANDIRFRNGSLCVRVCVLGENETGTVYVIHLDCGETTCSH